MTRVLAAVVALASAAALACSSILVSKGASADAAPMATYVADSHDLYGDLRHIPAATWPEGATLDVIEWDTGKKLGTIPQARRTFAVVAT